MSECGHEIWTLGCERCFHEMKTLASDNVEAVSQSDQMTQGAILFNWHILMVLGDLQVQLLPETRSLDLTRVELSKALINNLRQIEAYLIKLVSDPERLESALVMAAKVAQEARARLDAERASESAPAAEEKPSPIVLTDK